MSHMISGMTSCGHIPGIDCNVQNCIHHDAQNHCTAKSIQVGPNRATSGIDTVCVTFKPKSN